MAGVSSQSGVGPLLRAWRLRRRCSQMELALDAGVSTRHVSFVETGRSTPSPEMVLLLAESLEVPFRERNHLLLAAGYAPEFPQHSMSDPEMAPVREALDVILDAHEPNPAVVVDRAWNVVAANGAMAAMAEWVDPVLLEPPVNAMRVGLHPRGLARFTLNQEEVRAYFLGRLERQVAITGQDDLRMLLEEVSGYPPPLDPGTVVEGPAGQILTPLMRMRGPDDVELSFFATVVTFGSAAEVTTSELSIELTFPADLQTAAAMRELARTRKRPERPSKG